MAAVVTAPDVRAAKSSDPGHLTDAVPEKAEDGAAQHRLQERDAPHQQRKNHHDQYRDCERVRRGVRDHAHQRDRRHPDDAGHEPLHDRARPREVPDAIERGKKAQHQDERGQEAGRRGHDRAADAEELVSDVRGEHQH